MKTLAILFTIILLLIPDWLYKILSLVFALFCLCLVYAFLLGAKQMAMIDVSCPKCKKRFGFKGRMVNRPPCPKCGHVISQVELEKSDREMDLIREEMFGDARNNSLREEEKRNSQSGQKTRLTGSDRTGENDLV